MKTLHREPLIHFMILALGLFILHSAVSHEDANMDAKRIVVDEDGLLTFIQYRTKSFEPTVAKQQLESFTDKELQQVISDYIREEALYREAQALELGRDDYVIKRRLIQKVDYVARGFAESFDQISDDEIKQYFEENKNNYYINPRITFTHVFFSNDQHGADKAKQLAQQKLAELQQTKAGFNDAAKHGERFLYGLNYVERSEQYVQSHFGEQLTRQVFALQPDLSTWHGPIMSDHGAHLVMVSLQQAGRMPKLEEVYARVAQEAQRAIVAERAKATTQQIVDSYDIDVVYQQPEQKLARLNGNERE